MHLDFNKLKNDRVIEIDVHIFNATGSALRILRCDGSIQFRYSADDKFKSFEHAPSMVEKEIPSGEPGFIKLLQHVPSQIADKLLQHMGNSPPQFDFTLFNIRINGGDRLKLWEGVVAKRGGWRTERINTLQLIKD